MKRAYDARMPGKPDLMNGLLIYEMATKEKHAPSTEQGKQKINTGLWRAVEKNNHERYHSSILPLPKLTSRG